MLNNPDIVTEIDRDRKRDDQKLSDICDGEVFKTHPVVLAHGLGTLQILAYGDEVEICNPIGPKRRKHKITAFYWILSNVRPEYRSRLEMFNLFAVARSDDVKKIVMEKLLKVFVSDVNKLATKGLTINYGDGTPSAFTRTKSKPSEVLKVRSQSASQLWLLARVLPFVLAELLDPGDLYVHCFLLHVGILSSVMSQEYNHVMISNVSENITEFIDLFVGLYGSSVYTPKLHYYLHFPRLMH
eukprot:Lithocolla_globosa_v1_NODE_5447_length_1238_cov_4.871513.p1 type:complete len:242 gc:universal NODE_5447_length_1238_cov_4.871513:906-181(-)